MTQIDKQIALRAYLADFETFESLWKMVELSRTHINAAEGIEFTSKLLEIRIPFGFEREDFFANIPKSDVPFISHHAYTFIACLGSFNWCAIFGNMADFQNYCDNSLIAPFYISASDASNFVSKITCLCRPINDFETDWTNCPFHDPAIMMRTSGETQT